MLTVESAYRTQLRLVEHQALKPKPGVQTSRLVWKWSELTMRKSQTRYTNRLNFANLPAEKFFGDTRRRTERWKSIHFSGQNRKKAKRTNFARNDRIRNWLFWNIFRRLVGYLSQSAKRRKLQKMKEFSRFDWWRRYLLAWRPRESRCKMCRAYARSGSTPKWNLQTRQRNVLSKEFLKIEGNKTKF